jgi:hypothetical protein
VQFGLFSYKNIFTPLFLFFLTPLLVFSSLPLAAAWFSTSGVQLLLRRGWYRRASNKHSRTNHI